MNFLAFISSIFLLAKTGHSFSPASTLRPSSPSSSWQCAITRALCHQTKVVLLASPTDREETAVESAPLDTPVETKLEPLVAETESTPYPINLPSPLLLSASMILAIASTGSLFELTGDATTIGFGPTAAIAAIGLPSSLFLFYAAVLKGMAETEEDDRQYNKPKRF